MITTRSETHHVLIKIQRSQDVDSPYIIKWFSIVKVFQSYIMNEQKFHFYMLKYSMTNKIINLNMTMVAVAKPSGKINWSNDEWSGKWDESKAKVHSGNCLFLYPAITRIPLCTVKQIFYHIHIAICLTSNANKIVKGFGVFRFHVHVEEETWGNNSTKLGEFFPQEIKILTQYYALWEASLLGNVFFQKKRWKNWIEIKCREKLIENVLSLNISILNGSPSDVDCWCRFISAFSGASGRQGNDINFMNPWNCSEFYFPEILDQRNYILESWVHMK